MGIDRLEATGDPSADGRDGSPGTRRLPVSTGPLGVLDWGGDGPDLLFLHPNGLCAGLFDPLAQRLRGRWRVVGIDLRGHGGSDDARSPLDLRFNRLARDVVEALDLLGVDHVDVVGQSLGGGVGVLVDRLCPGRIRRLVLAEAVAFAPTRLSAEGPRDNPMSAAARRRRSRWPNEAAARERFLARRPLRDLGPEFLEAYIRWGTEVNGAGEVALCCRPETEADVFEISATPGGAPDAWSHLDDVTARAAVVVGAGSDLPRVWFDDQAARMGAGVTSLSGGHFMLQTDPDEVAEIVNRLLTDLEGDHR